MFWVSPFNHVVKIKTGWYRNGSCETDESDGGRHVVCAKMTDEFLSFSKAMGNDLSTLDQNITFPDLRVAIAGACVLPAGRKQMKQALLPGLN